MLGWAWSAQAQESTEIEVVGERSDAQSYDLSGEEAARLPGAFGDPLRAAQNFPGVARPLGVDGALVVRGAESRQTGFRIDDVPLPFGFHLLFGRSIVEPSRVTRLTLLPGGLPARYGEVSQGLLQVETAPPGEGLPWRVAVDLLDGGYAGSGRVGAWRYDGWLRSSLLGPAAWAGARLRAASLGVPAWSLAWLAPVAADGRFRLERELPLGTFRVTALGAQDLLRQQPALVDEDGDGRPEPAPDPGLPWDPQVLVATSLARLELRLEDAGPRGRRMSSLVVGPDSRQSTLTGYGLLVDGPEKARFGGLELLARQEQVLALGPRDALETGVQGWLRPWWARTLDEAAPPPDQGVSHEAALSAEWRRAGSVEGRLGGRLQAGNQGFSASPRLALAAPVTPLLRLHFGLARQVAPAPVEALAPSLGGDLGRAAVSSWQVQSGLEQALGRGALRLTSFASRLEDVPVEIERPFLVQGASTGDPLVVLARSEVASAEGRAAGAEALASWPLGDEGWLRGTLNLVQTWRLAEGLGFVSDRDLPWDLSLAAGAGLGRGWSLSGRFRAGAGFPYTPEQGVYLVEQDAWLGLSGPRNSERGPHFHQLDLRVERRWIRQAESVVWLDVANVYGARNPLVISYTPDYRRTVTRLALPPMPLLGFSLQGIRRSDPGGGPPNLGRSDAQEAG